MPSDPPRTYFDSSVYVAVMLGSDEPNVELAQAALLDAEHGNTTGVFSSLVVAETIGCHRMRVGDGTDEDRQARLARARTYFETSRFTFAEDSRRVALRAAQLAIEHNLRGPDALHLALAESAGCQRFFSLDNDHLKVRAVGFMPVTRPYGSPQSSFDV